MKILESYFWPELFRENIYLDTIIVILLELANWVYLPIIIRLGSSTTVFVLKQHQLIDLNIC